MNISKICKIDSKVSETYFRKLKFQNVIKKVTLNGNLVLKYALLLFFMSKFKYNLL